MARFVSKAGCLFAEQEPEGRGSGKSLAAAKGGVLFTDKQNTCYILGRSCETSTSGGHSEKLDSFKPFEIAMFILDIVVGVILVLVQIKFGI
ncbi:hypothetical protein KXD93_15170 [Mucilaginibacter sp. BJC16-A38]|uniref:hypothetical protein n=1 Tax=Mucilaginibacter phenanthrenivorans TaxID=1234842 RepID=UPI002157495B|nr:hypothetical protein [Mucilaginibacter phenanthrenivorans]MCR8558997.1 hypothetical protein [Mucilaginibacter phenanthrenivorans]